jgi:MFS transporter, PPP family, 3-phenylpropionic acid transporter
VSEVPAFYLSTNLLKRWPARYLVAAGMAFSLIRLLGYGLIHVPIWVLPLQIFYGPSFSTSWSGGVAYSNELAPEGMGATAQSLYSGVTMGLAHMAGSALFGLLYDQYGSHNIFLIGAGVVACALALFLASSKRVAHSES